MVVGGIKTISGHGRIQSMIGLQSHGESLRSLIGLQKLQQSGIKIHIQRHVDTRINVDILLLQHCLQHQQQSCINVNILVPQRCLRKQLQTELL